MIHISTFFDKIRQRLSSQEREPREVAHAVYTIAGVALPPSSYSLRNGILRFRNIHPGEHSQILIHQESLKEVLAHKLNIVVREVC